MERRILHRVACTVLQHSGADHREAPHVVADGEDWNSEIHRRIYERAQIRHHRRRRMQGYLGHPETPPDELLMPEDGGATTLLWEPLPPEEEALVAAHGHDVPPRLPFYRVTLANAPSAVMRLVGEAAVHDTMPLMALHGWTRIQDGIDLEESLPWLSTLLPALAYPHCSWCPNGDGGESPHLRWLARGWDGRLELPYGVALSGMAGNIISTSGLATAMPPESDPGPDVAEARPRASSPAAQHRALPGLTGFVPNARHS